MECKVQFTEKLIDFIVYISSLQQTIKATLQADIGGLGFVDRRSNNTILLSPAGRKTDKLVGLPIPYGKGLAGIVQLKQRPFSLKNYLSDQGIIHDNRVDFAVSNEGIISSAGAPIYDGRQILGIIYAWRRNRKYFDKSDLSILGKLGERFSKHLEANKYQEIYNNIEIGELIKFIEINSPLSCELLSVYEQLMQISIDGELTDVVNVLADYFKQPVAILDEKKQVKAKSQNFKSEEDTLLQCIYSNHETLDISNSNFIKLKNNGILSPIRVGHCIIGYLYIKELSLPLALKEEKLIKSTCMIVTMYDLREKIAQETRKKYQSAIINNLLKGNFDRDTLLQQCKNCGIDLNRPHRLILLERNHLKKEIDVYTLNRVESLIGGFSCLIDKYFVMLLPVENHELALNASKDLIKNLNIGIQNTKPYALLTEICVKTDEYSQKYKEAVSFFELNKEDISEQVISLEQLGPQRLFIHPANQGYLKSHVINILGPLIDYDKKRNTALVDTLIEYFDNGCNRQNTAQKMNIHVHTLDYRLQRIQEILNTSINELNTRSNLHLTIEAYKTFKRFAII